jgi:hypothetical protein
MRYGGVQYPICAHITLIILDRSSIYEKPRVPGIVKSRMQRGQILWSGKNTNGSKRIEKYFWTFAWIPMVLRVKWDFYQAD